MPAGFHSATSFVEANALFQFETDATALDGFTNVLGFYLDSWGDKPLSDEQLLNIADNAANVARELLDEQVYDRYSTTDRTYTLRSSIRTDTSDGNINVFSDARAPNGYPYAGSIEYGFHPYGHDDFIPPRPFLRPALEYAINATRTSWFTNVEYMVEAMKRNELSLSHFNGKTAIGASRRNWGRNIAERTGSAQSAMMRNAASAGRSRGNYSHAKNQAEYGTAKGAYRGIWDIDRGYR